MEISQFEQFRMIAQCGTMSEAAKRLYVSQPTLSYNLKQLESELGCKLFTRAHNQLRLSPYGELVLSYANQLSECCQSMVREVEDLKRREAATLHIGSFSPIASCFLMPHVASELADGTFEVVNCSTASLKAGLSEGRFDVLIASDICRDKSFVWRNIYVEQAYLSAPASVGLLSEEEVDGASLASLRFSIEAGLAGYSDWFMHILREAGVPEASVERVELMEHLRTKDALPTCNLITSFIMDFVRTNDARVIVPIAESYARRNVGLLYRRDAPDKVQSFVRYVCNNAAHLFSGNAFVPFLMFPDDSKNLRMTSE